MIADDWQYGTPPTVGEWEVREDGNPYIRLSWWDGARWSIPYGPHYHDRAKQVLRTLVAKQSKIMQWRAINCKG